MALWPDVIMTPLHIHNAQSAADYKTKQRLYIANARRQYPALVWRDPWLALERPEVQILAGKWLVWCACGNYPSVHPEWRLACCFECGAIYEDLVITAEAIEVARLLARRPSVANRGWLGESLDTIRAENLAHGVEA